MVRALAVLAVCAFASPTLAQEKFVGSNIDVRTVLSFKVSDAAVQKLLPQGWELNTPPAGPAQGSNLSLVLVDSVMAQDPEGKPQPPFRGAVLAIPAKKSGQNPSLPTFMIVGGLVGSDVAPGAYGVYMPAKTVIDRKVRTEEDGKSRVEESWSFTAQPGSAIDVQGDMSAELSRK